MNIVTDVFKNNFQNRYIAEEQLWVSDFVLQYTQSDLRFDFLLECCYLLLKFRPQSSSKVCSCKSKIVSFTIVSPSFVIDQFNSPS